MLKGLKPLAIGILVLTAASCGTRSATDQVAGPSESAEAADACHAHGDAVANNLGSDARLVNAVRTSVRQLIAWQRSRFSSEGGPALEDAGLQSRSGRDLLYVCIYDGQFDAAVKAPPGLAAPASDRIVILVEKDGRARLELTTTQQRLSSDGPSPE